MLKAYKYRIEPDVEQTELLNKHFGSVRFVYNHYLNERKQEYETNKQTLNYYDNARSLTELKADESHSWLREINSQSLQHSLKSLEGAYNNFFKKRGAFPRFKSRKDKNSFCVPQFVKVDQNNGLLSIPKFKNGIKIVMHRKFMGVIKQCTISKTPTGKFFVSILVETEHRKVGKTGLSVGIDLGLKDFVITSDGQKYKNNRYTKTHARKLKKAQQHLSRKVKGSNRYNKQRMKVALIHEKITNSRNDNLHKVSTDLIRKYDTIFVEDLNIKGMVKNHKLSKHISDASWGAFVQMLKYKAEWNDKQVVNVGRWFPSSKTCGSCGYINQDLNLDIRTWKCPSCGETHDRDLNAARNILKEGLKEISSGTDDNRHGAEISPASVGTGDEVSKIRL